MLEGSLKDFPVADVLRLLASTRKTGRLVITAERRGGTVLVSEGRLRFADMSGDGLGLARRLAAADLLPDALIEELGARTPDVLAQGMTLVTELLDARAAVGDDLRRVMGDYLTDEIGQVLDWQEGNFAFEGGDVAEAAGLALEVDAVLSQARERLQAWREVSAQLPDSEMILILVPAKSDELALTVPEWEVLSLVDGRRSIDEIIGLLGRGPFTGADLILAALRTGLVEARPSLTGVAVPPVVRRLQRLDDVASHTRKGSARRLVEQEPVEEPSVEEPADAEPERPRAEAPEASPRLKPIVSRPDAIESVTGRGASDRQLTTDPSIDEDLVRRLIDGVKDL